MPISTVDRPHSRALSPRRLAAGLSLGLLGLALNTFDVEVFTEETPKFLFGGVPVLVAFLWAGPVAGLIAGVLSLGESLARLDAVGFATLVYVAEAWFVAALLHRTHSLVLNVFAFWLTAGAFWNILFYKAIIGLPPDYLWLLYVKQVVGGTVNALLVEVVIVALRPTRWALPALRGATLFDLTRQRVLLAMMLPIVALTVVLGRVTFKRQIDTYSLQQYRSIATIRDDVRRFTTEFGGAITTLAGEVGVRLAHGRPVSSADLRSFHEENPGFLDVAMVDPAGTVMATSPEINALGQPLVGASIADREYFARARAGRILVVAPVIPGTLNITARDGVEPVIVMAYRVSGPGGEFLGLITGAVRADGVLDLLERARRRSDEVSTLVDGDRRVIASLDPRLTPGTALPDVLPESFADGYFRFYPPSDGTLESRLRINPQHAVFEPLPSIGWGLIVGIPASSVHQAMLVPVLWILAGFAMAVAITHLAASSIARSVTRPIVAASEAAQALAAGRFDATDAPTASDDADVAETARLGAAMGELAASLRHYRDLSDARQTELEERFRATFEQDALGILYLSPDGRVQLANDRCCTIVGWNREHLIGEPLARAVPVGPGSPGGREAIASPDVNHHETNEYEVVRPDGSTVWVRLTLAPVRTSDGEVKYYIGALEDISPRKRLESSLLHAQKLESVGRLAGGVAHDFNNLLTAILGYTDDLLDTLSPGDPRHDDLLEVQRAATRAAQLTGRLLAFARRSVVDVRVVDLNVVVDQAESMVRRLIGEHLRLDVIRGRDLWPVKVDLGQMEQVLLNLVVNARDAMPDGGVISIETSNRIDTDPATAARREVVTLAVRDTGHGLTPEARVHLFEPFFTTKALDKGTGLGLATCYGIVTQAGGRIDVESEEALGTAFTVVLPRADEEATGEAPSSDATAPPATGTVLLVEDEEGVARFARGALTRQGYVVLEARDGVEALALARAHRGAIDVLVSDVVMPNMGGRQLATALLEERPALKVLLMSGYAPEAFGADGDGRLPWPLLDKPFTARKLCLAVHDLLHPRT